MNQEELNKILRKHRLWLNNEIGGEKAVLDHTDLRGLNLYGATLDEASLVNTLLRAADLTRASLIIANLSGCDLKNAEMKKTDICGANLKGANLSSANLYKAAYDKYTIFPDDFDVEGDHRMYKVVELYV